MHSKFSFSTSPFMHMRIGAKTTISKIHLFDECSKSQFFTTIMVELVSLKIANCSKLLEYWLLTMKICIVRVSKLEILTENRTYFKMKKKPWKDKLSKWLVLRKQSKTINLFLFWKSIPASLKMGGRGRQLTVQDFHLP